MNWWLLEIIKCFSPSGRHFYRFGILGELGADFGKNVKADNQAKPR